MDLKPKKTDHFNDIFHSKPKITPCFRPSEFFKEYTITTQFNPKVKP